MLRFPLFASIRGELWQKAVKKKGAGKLPCVNGDPDGIQTHDLQNRNLTLYSAKLRGPVDAIQA